MLASVFLLLSGVHCGYRFGGWPLALTGAAICAAILLSSGAGKGCDRIGWLRRLGWAALLFGLGWGRAAWDEDGREEEADRLRAAEGRPAFICRVGPEVSVTAKGNEGARYAFRAESIRFVGGGVPESIRYLPVEVRWFGSRRSEEGCAPQPGELWRMVGRPNVRQGRDGLLSVTVNTGEERSKRLATADEGSWLVRLVKARRTAARRVTIGIEDWGVVPVLNTAMMLGCRGELPTEMRSVFRNSGTIHVFAISGLNIALVAGLLIVVVSGLGVPRPYWVVGVAPLLIFYTLASGAQPSAVRACIMAIIYFAAPLFGRKPNGLTALLSTALLVYAWMPHLIYNIGCTLSFAVMGGLVVFCRPFCDIGRRLCRVPRLEELARLYEKAGSRMAGARVRWLAAAVRFGIDSVAVSLAAWLASLPLSAYYFGRFTPGGFLANLVIAPCAFLVMVAGSLGLVTSTVSSWVASCYNHAAGFFTVIMIRTAEITVAFRWSNFRIERWQPWMVWGWFLLLGACALWMHLRRPNGLAWLGSGAEEKDGI